MFDGVTGASVLASEATFTGGVYVAAADIDGDGKAEVVVTPDESGGPVVAVDIGAKLAAGLAGDAAEAARFLGIAGEPYFRSGARPALADLVASAGATGGPRTALFDGQPVLTGAADPRRVLPDFFAFENTLRNGAFVASGDVTGDGAADLAFGGGLGGAPRVRLFDGAALLAGRVFVG